MRLFIFIAGCARSGTTLFRALFRDVRNATVTGSEAHHTEFNRESDQSKIQVIKRTSNSWRTLHELPEDVKLAYCIRHPYDVLTSTHENTPPGRQFYVTPERWISEYEALKALRLAQPEREIFIAKYEDVVLKTEKVGKEVCSFFDIELKAPFGSARPPFSSSLYKWKKDPMRAEYIENLPEEFMTSVSEFCSEFGYQL